MLLTMAALEPTQATPRMNTGISDRKGRRTKQIFQAKQGKIVAQRLGHLQRLYIKGNFYARAI